MRKTSERQSSLAAFSLLVAALAAGGCSHQVVRFADRGALDANPAILTHPLAFRIIRDEGTADITVSPFSLPGIPIDVPAQVELHNSEPGIQFGSGVIEVQTAGIRPVVHTTNVTAGAQGTTFSLVAIPGFGDVVLVTRHEGPGTAVVVKTLDNTQTIDLPLGPLALYDAATGRLTLIAPETVPMTGGTTLQQAARALLNLHPTR